jgi:hypothetical protein
MENQRELIVDIIALANNCYVITDAQFRSYIMDSVRAGYNLNFFNNCLKYCIFHGNMDVLTLLSEQIPEIYDLHMLEIVNDNVVFIGQNNMLELAKHVRKYLTEDSIHKQIVLAYIYNDSNSLSANDVQKLLVELNGNIKTLQSLINISFERHSKNDFICFLQCPEAESICEAINRIKENNELCNTKAIYLNGESYTFKIEKIKGKLRISISN